MYILLLYSERSVGLLLYIFLRLRQAVKMCIRDRLEPYREFEIKGIASSGAKGKKMIMELHPDLLFLDVELPDILGLNLLREIKDDVLCCLLYTSRGLSA